ncbi:ribosomal protein S18-alanine N-acetyltransferase [Candidatus Saganbacteria bacterium]|nr:ribosomal protein S18-alanine N-acetyltransferase [Candidatus Saganbacteria bacterium]
MIIVKAKKNDLESISEIENHSFSTPWPQDQLEECLDRTYIAQENGKTKGFICIDKAFDEVHILHMAVHNEHRRKGIGKKLIEYAMSFGGNKLFLEVRESNLQAIKLYESFGFKTISRRKKYYQDNDEGALIMELKKTN